MGIIEMVFKVVKSWVTKKAEETENKEFIARVTATFTAIEELLAELKKLLADKK